MPRPIKEVTENLELAIKLVRNGDLLGIRQHFKTPALDVIGSVLRSVFIAKPGYKLLICDLSAIENRVLGYICKADSILKVFRDGLDPYKWFAVDLFGVPYEEVTKQMRQDAKPAVLGGGYALGPGERRVSDEGDEIYTGLMKYARSMGIPLTQETANRSIEVFRSKHWEVKQNWKDLEQAAKKCIRSRQPITVNDIIRFSMVDDVLVATMPSGRSLHYLQPKIIETERQGRDGPYTAEVVEYWGMDHERHSYGRTTIYGGKFLENFDQSISRDLLVHGMKLADKRGLPIVAHTHDEIVCEVPDSKEYTVDMLKDCMIDKPSWSNHQLIIDAAGFESYVYRKE